MLAIGGLSGSGKSVLARALAPRLGRAPGAVWLRSDVERKHYFGIDETAPLPDEAYRPEVSREIYARIEAKASAALAAGHSALLDAVHARADARREARGAWCVLHGGVRRGACGVRGVARGVWCA